MGLTNVLFVVLFGLCFPFLFSILFLKRLLIMSSNREEEILGLQKKLSMSMLTL